MASSQDMVIEHPNGSDGWLPAEQPEPVDTPHRSSTTKRKRVFGRHSSQQQRESAVVPLVNDNGTTPAAVDDTPVEDLKNRAVSANNSLTPKQRSRIAKSEGQSKLIIITIIFCVNALF